MNEEKKPYVKPELEEIDLEETVMVAASRSGMGMCKITYQD